MRKALLFVCSFIAAFSFHVAQAQGALVAYYPFNGNANDESGNGNHGVINGAMLTVDRFGNPNSAMRFDGISSEIGFGANRVLNLMGNFSIQAWINLETIYENNSAWPTIISETGADRHIGEFVLRMWGPKVEFFRRPTEGNRSVMDVVSVTQLTPHSTYQIVAVYDGSLHLYINGVLDPATEYVDAYEGPGATQTRIGNGPYPSNNEYFNGVIDDIRIYNRALSIEEIQSLYSEGNTYALNTMVVGNGLVHRTPDLPLYNTGAVVSLSATPDPGWTFTGWSGDASGSTNPLSVTMNAAKNITATFTCALAVNAGPDIIVYFGYAPLAYTQLNATMSPVISGATYSWLPATGLSSTTIANPVAAPMVTTTYEVKVVANGCTTTDQVTVTVEDVRCGNNLDKVSILHRLGNGGFVQICVSLNALPTHLAHGDVFGLGKVGAEVAEIPKQFGLQQNYPNPFNPSTTIRYALPVDAQVTLEVYDMLGRSVAELVNGEVKAGYHDVNFDASNLASGLYVYRLQSNAGNGKSEMQMRKLILLK